MVGVVRGDMPEKPFGECPSEVGYGGIDALPDPGVEGRSAL